MQTIAAFRKAHLTRNIEHCSKNVRFYEIPKKEQNFDKTPKKLRFFTEKTSKNNHFNSQLQVVCYQNVAHFLAKPNQNFFGIVLFCCFEEKQLCVRENNACGEFRTPKMTEIGSVVAEILTFLFVVTWPTHLSYAHLFSCSV